MRIAVYHDLPSGGAKRALFEICRSLYEMGHTIDLFVPDTANEIFLPMDGVVSAKRVFHVYGAGKGDKTQPASWTIWAWMMAAGCHRRIAESINAGKYDLAFVQQARYPNIPDLLRYLKIPSVLYCQEPNRILYEAPIRTADFGMETPGPATSSRRYLGNENFRRTVFGIIHRKGRDRANMAQASMVFVNSYYSKESVLRTFGLDAIVQYLGVDSQSFRPMDIPRENRVMSVGAIHPSKGHRFLLASVAKIDSARRPGVLIIGDREKPGERAFLTRMALDTNVDLSIQTVDENALVRHYNSVQAVATVPYLEPFGFTPLEAMACKTPVVGVREGGVRESVIHGRTGYLVDRDPQDCADALDRIISNSELRDQLGTEGRKVVEAQWTWQGTARRIESSFKALVNA